MIGASGAGKTQLLKILAGDVWPDDAEVAAAALPIAWRWHVEPAAVRDEIAWLGPERQDRYERYGWNYPALEVVGTGLHRTDIPLHRLSAADRARCLALLRRAGMRASGAAAFSHAVLWRAAPGAAGARAGLAGGSAAAR